MSPVVVVVLLTLLLGIQPVATDLYLPAMPTLQRELGAGIASTQLTLSALILAFGVAQLVAGPLADRYGRRPLLIGGMATYALACFAAAWSPTIEVLVFCRVLQGIGIAAAVTCGRALVRALSPPHEGAKVISKALTGLGIISTSAPLVGGLLVHTLGWRAPLAASGVFGAAALAFIMLRYEETVPAKNPLALQPGPLWRNATAVLAHPTFRAWAALLCCTYGGLFLFLSASSIVFIDQRGESRLAYAVLLATASVSYVSGTFWCRRLLARHGLRGAVRRAAWLTLVGGVSMAALDAAGVRSVWAILIPQWIFSFGHGVHQPCGQAAAVGPFPEKAGTASAITGFLMMSVAFGAGIWLGRTLHGVSWPMTGGIALFSTLLAVVAWTLVQRHGDAQALAERSARAAA
mgnify:CR=1 FL=1